MNELNRLPASKRSAYLRRHGVPLSTADTELRIKTMLRHWSQWSDDAIAGHIGCHAVDVLLVRSGHSLTSELADLGGQP